MSCYEASMQTALVTSFSRKDFAAELAADRVLIALRNYSNIVAHTCVEPRWQDTLCSPKAPSYLANMKAAMITAPMAS